MNQHNQIKNQESSGNNQSLVEPLSLQQQEMVKGSASSDTLTVTDNSRRQGQVIPIHSNQVLFS